MKKTSLKALLLILTLALLTVGSITVVSAAESNDESDLLKVSGCNLSFENEVFVMYAIKSQDPNLKLLVWEATQNEYTYGTQKSTLSSTETVTNNGITYSVFKYTGLAAKQMTDDIYVRAYIPGEDGNDQYGDVHKYSILQYAYNKLGKTGTASTNPKLIKMLNAMLEYGAATQEYKDYRLDRLANADFYQIKLNDGRLPDGFNKGLYKVGSTVTITAPETNAEGKDFSHWEDKAGTKVATTASCEVTVGTSNMEYTAVYNSYSEGFEFTLSADKTYYSVTGIGTETDSVEINIPPTHEGLPVTQIGDNAFQNCSKLTSIIIPDNVTSIGSSAFSGCIGLTSIEIPNSVTSLGQSAFSGCTGLTSVTIPFVGTSNSITSSTCFGNIFGAYSYSYNDDYIPTSLKTVVITGGEIICGYAFSNCTGLTSITLPDSITTIGNYAFENCEGLTSISIPESVTSIGRSAFTGCNNLEDVHINNIASWCNIKYGDEYNSNPLYYYAKYLYLNGSLITELEIPEGVTEIAPCAFKNQTSITKVMLPSTITKIGNEAFYNATKLTSITIPNSVTNIGSAAFYECTGLASITIPGGVKNIGDNAFYGCYGLENIIVDTENTVYHSTNNCLIETQSKTLIKGCKNSIIPADGSVTSIGNYAFSDCTGLFSIVIPDSVTSIGARAFLRCTDLTSITIPFLGEKKDGTGKTHFGYIFGANSSSDNYNNVPSSLKNVVLTGGESIYSGAFRGCSGLTNIVIPNNIITIGGNAFASCSGLTKITIPDTVTSIGDYAFTSCTGITKITIPDSVTSIGDSAFNGCTKLEKITIPFVGANKDGSGDTRFGYIFGKSWSSTETFNNTSVPPSLSCVVITGGTMIASNAFRSCSELISITIPSSVVMIGYDAFYGCVGLEEVHISNLSAWCNIDFIDAESNPLHSAQKLYLNGQLITDLVIPEGVTSIPTYAFKNQSSIVNVTISSTVTSISTTAFGDCTGLKSIIIPNNVTIIGDEAFRNCTELKSVVISDGVLNIGSCTFYGCTGLLDITIPQSVTNIGAGAFYECTALESITIPFVGENKDGTGATNFGYIFSLPSDNYNLNVPSSLKNVVITGGESIVGMAFDNCINLINISLPDSITSIGSYAFDRCSQLENIEIPNSITIIDGSAFRDCSKLKYNEYDNAYYLGNKDNPFLLLIKTKNNSITSCEINNNTKFILSNSFDYCRELTSIVIPDSVIYIDYTAFNYCTSLASITIGSGATYIEAYAFYNCTNLTNVTFENTDGWWVSTDSSATSGTSIDVTDAAVNATNLKTTYYNYYWKRS